MPVKKASKPPGYLSGQLSKALILVGLVILVTVVFLLKNQASPAKTLEDQTPEAQLDAYLGNHQPVLVFFHSTTCKSCIDMMGIVDQVYPEFNRQVGLVDVQVYDSDNEALIRRARISNIPTQVFINAKGEGNTVIGGMQPDELRTELQAIADRAPDGD